MSLFQIDKTFLGIHSHLSPEMKNVMSLINEEQDFAN